MATASEVAKYLLHLDDQSDGDGISNLKLQKLAYYAQGFHLALFDEPLFSDRIEAWQHGPVVPTLYQTYSRHGRERIEAPAGFDPDILTPDQRGLIDEVFEVFGQFSAWKLRNMTHDEPPWIDHKDDRSEIPHDELKRYFVTQLV